MKLTTVSSLKILCVVAIMGVMFSILYIGNDSTVQAQEAETNTPTPEPTESHTASLEEAINVAIENHIETSIDNYYYKLIGIVESGNWGIGKAEKIQKDTLEVIPADFSMILGHRQDSGDWQVVLPNEADTYLDLLTMFPTSLLESERKEYMKEAYTAAIPTVYANHFLPWVKGSAAIVYQNYFAHGEGQLDFGFSGTIRTTKAGTLYFAYDSHTWSKCTGQTLSWCNSNYPYAWYYDNAVVIKHADGEYSSYLHLQTDSIPTEIINNCNNGNGGSCTAVNIPVGTVIGNVGSTGLSTVAHLHYGTGDYPYGRCDYQDVYDEDGDGNTTEANICTGGIDGSHRVSTDFYEKPYTATNCGIGASQDPKLCMLYYPTDTNLISQNPGSTNNPGSMGPLYATTPSGLWQIDPFTGSGSLVRSLSYSFTDIAFDGRTLYGITFSQLFSINPVTGTATLIGSIGQGDVNALTIGYDGTLYAGKVNGALVKVNKSTGAGTLVGYYGTGIGSSGDLAILYGNMMYASVTRSGYATDWLAQINMSNGKATLIGSLGESAVYGLDFIDGNIYAITESGFILKINAATGASTRIKALSGNFWGLSTNFPIGPLSSPTPVEGNFYGDGRDETGIFDTGNSTWYIKGMAPIVYGQSGDIPVPADYNGDGRDELAVFRPSNSTWYIRGVGPAVYGTVGDIPVVADYTGDGKADIAVFRPSNSTWYIRGMGAAVYGTVGDIPVVADYTGDGKADIAVFRPTNSTWYLYGIGPAVYGTVGDIPVVADYTGDGKADIAVFRPSNSTWYIYGIGPAVYGTAGDVPIIGDYNGDGRADIAVFRPGDSTFYLRAIGKVVY